MFAEELSGNASKKRQEEARRRRRQLKLQEQRKNKKDANAGANAGTSTTTTVLAAAAAASTSASGDREVASASGTGADAGVGAGAGVGSSPAAAVSSSGDGALSNGAANGDAERVRGGGGGGRVLPAAAKGPGGGVVDAAIAGAGVTATGPDPTLKKTKKMTAVEQALHQRTMREATRRKARSALVLQSSWRRRASNYRRDAEQRASFDRRVSDVRTLATMLAKIQQQKAGQDQAQGKGKDGASGQLNADVNSTAVASASAPGYVPPPATVSAMTTQFLSFCRFLRRDPSGRNNGPICTTSWRLAASDAARLQHLLEYVVMPGLLGPDGELDSLASWVDDVRGRLRLTDLVTATVEAMVLSRKFVVDGHHRRRAPASGSVGDSEDSSTDQWLSAEEVDRSLALLMPTTCRFLRIVAGCHGVIVIGPDGGVRARGRERVVRHCRSLLFHPTLSDETRAKRGGGTSPATMTKTTDLIWNLRRFLLYQVGGSKPIHDNASTLRERITSEAEKRLAGQFFSLTLDGVLAAGSGFDAVALSSRFVTDALSVPLLSWKMNPEGIQSLLQTRTTATNDNHKPSAYPPVVLLLSRFMQHISPALLRHGSDERDVVRSAFPADYDLRSCPAPAPLCLFANLIQWMHLCPVVNPAMTNPGSGGGPAPSSFLPSATVAYFNVLTLLLQCVPLGVFASRSSAAVEWIREGREESHYTPILVSEVVLDQCRLLLLDSYARAVFRRAIEVCDDSWDTRAVLDRKTEKDREGERELDGVATVSTKSLAAREAREEEARGFWTSRSKWAKQLGRKVSSLFNDPSSPSSSSGRKKKPSPGGKGEGALVNTSLVSRQLASGRGGGSSSSRSTAVTPGDTQSTSTGVQLAKAAATPASREAPVHSVHLLLAACRLYGTVLARWGGGGVDRIHTPHDHTHSSSSSSGVQQNEQRKQLHTEVRATSKAEPCVLTLLNVMCFSTGIVKTLWAMIQSGNPEIASDMKRLSDKGAGGASAAPIRALRVPTTSSSHVAAASRGADASATNNGAVVLFVFASCLSHVLVVTDDTEIFDLDEPIPKHQFRRCILLLKGLLYRSCCLDEHDSSVARRREGEWDCESNYFGLSLISAAAKTMKDLHDRSSRRPLCVPKVWAVDDLLEKDLGRCRSYEDYVSLLTSPVLRLCPFLVPLKRRLKLFDRIVTTNRVLVQGCNEQHTLRPGLQVRIVRGRILEDGLTHLNSLGRNLRQRLVVQYCNQAGTMETGMDIGGLFKEFWGDLSNLAFDPNYALFRVTEGSDNCLYPNPSSRAAHGRDHIVLFEFLGRILGKALYEGITIQPQFAHFFLAFLRGDYNFLHMLPDLSTMDPQLYHNLMFLKTYEGDATDLCLTFTVADDDFGSNSEAELIPNGTNIEVTNSNKQRYIGLVAKHHVYDRIREQSEAFTRGLWDVIDSSWLRLFDPNELQVLISGSSEGKIDVSDMKANTRYAGGYTSLDVNIHRFWHVVSRLTSKQQASLLRFVTSCERPPPLGFSSMNPPFTIQRVGIARDGDKLPSASTCFNTLKLPTYSSEKVLRDRLIYAIESGAGFELT